LLVLQCAWEQAGTRDTAGEREARRAGLTQEKRDAEDADAEDADAEDADAEDADAEDARQAAESARQAEMARQRAEQERREQEREQEIAHLRQARREQLLGSLPSEQREQLLAAEADAERKREAERRGEVHRITMLPLVNLDATAGASGDQLNGYAGDGEEDEAVEAERRAAELGWQE
jgi:hypothetical protein